MDYAELAVNQLTSAGEVIAKIISAFLGYALHAILFEQIVDGFRV